ncbi:hypothetical protein K439DRAFT_1361116, partial [Ramaria rubella]
PLGIGRVAMSNADLRRLEPGKYLNDTLIELGLKMWFDTLHTERFELAKVTHLFSLFFYPTCKSSSMSYTGYKHVKRWTSRHELFKKS